MKINVLILIILMIPVVVFSQHIFGCTGEIIKEKLCFGYNIDRHWKQHLLFHGGLTLSLSGLGYIIAKNEDQEKLVPYAAFVGSILYNLSREIAQASEYTSSDGKNFKRDFFDVWDFSMGIIGWYGGNRLASLIRHKTKKKKNNLFRMKFEQID